MLEEICASDRPACQNFVRSHLEELQSALLGSLPSATSPAKRVRKVSGEKTLVAFPPVVGRVLKHRW